MREEKKTHKQKIFIHYDTAYFHVVNVCFPLFLSGAFLNITFRLYFGQT